MARIEPLEGYVVRPDLAAEVVAPAYDALTPGQRGHHASAHPRSFLSVLPTRDDLDEQQLTEAADRLRSLLDAGTFDARPRPFLAVYRLELGVHVQTGLVADLSVEALQSGQVRPHERTQDHRVHHLARFLAVVGVASSPVALAFAPDPALRGAIRRAAVGAPRVEVLTGDGVLQQLWVVDDPEEVAALVSLVGRDRRFVITDGHHRAAAAATHAHAYGVGGGHPAGRLLVCAFPADDLQVLPSDRIVAGLQTTEMAAFPGRLAAAGMTVEPLRALRRPAATGHFTMLLPDGAYAISVPLRVRDGGPVAGLDVAVLHDEVLPLVLDTDDPASDARLAAVPATGAGTEGDLRRRAERVGRGDAVAFLARPPTMAQIMAVADAGQVLPPKSTSFTPKLRSGLVLRFRRS